MEGKTQWQRERNDDIDKFVREQRDIPIVYNIEKKQLLAPKEKHIKIDISYNVNNIDQPTGKWKYKYDDNRIYPQFVKFTTIKELKQKIEKALIDLRMLIQEDTNYTYMLEIDNIEINGMNEQETDIFEDKIGGASKTDEMYLRKMKTTVEMWAARVITFDFLKGVSLNIPTDDLSCVENALLNIYKPKIPTLTVEDINGFINIVQRRELHSGYTTDEIDKFCEYYNISHYAVDINHCCYFKRVRTK